MSRSFPPHHPYHRPLITVQDHDVLSGRGVNIALHPGNQRFRTLVTTRADENYCMSYSATEKKAVAEEIIKHIQSLDPPGRFLQRDGRGQITRGLNGPWTELTHSQAVKKTCQALRDCNRPDREGYAVGVAMPDDVAREAERLANSGMTSRQQAAATVAAEQASRTVGYSHPLPAYVTPQAAAAAAAAMDMSFKRDREEAFGTPTATSLDEDGRVSPSIENAAEWLKKQRTDEAAATAAAVAASADLNGYGQHHSDHVDAQVMASAAAVFHHQGAADLLQSSSSSKHEDEDDDHHHDDDDDDIGYQTHMALNADDVHQEGLNIL